MPRGLSVLARRGGGLFRVLVATTLVAVVLGLVVWFLGADSDAREGARQSAIGEGGIRAE